MDSIEEKVEKLQKDIDYIKQFCEQVAEMLDAASKSPMAKMFPVKLKINK